MMRRIIKSLKLYFQNRQERLWLDGGRTIAEQKKESWSKHAKQAPVSGEAPSSSGS